MYLFSFRKSFRLKNKYNWRSRKKQVDALENMKSIEQSKAITDDESLEQKEESYSKLLDKKLDEYKSWVKILTINI